MQISGNDANLTKTMNVCNNCKIMRKQPNSAKKMHNFVGPNVCKIKNTDLQFTMTCKTDIRL